MLKEYNSKRDFKKTPEPSGKAPSKSQGALKFVIQKHAARRLHYDFRLEIDGVLVSWAVPKGPALDPAEKRLAVQTEDHPMDYGNFEGIIPKGEYGGGEVIVWDSGTYTPDEEGKLSWHNRDEAQQRMRDGFKKGKISIFLEGNKLRGSWTLVKLKKTEKEWLLIKHSDPFARTDKDPTDDDQSVLTGRTLVDVKAGKAGKKIQPKQLDVGKAKRFPTSIKPMTASLADKPFNKEGWVFEPKMDGIRAIAFIQDGKVVLKSRNDLELTQQFPAIAANLANYKGSFVLDGEIIALNEKGRPSFQHLQQRSGSNRGADVNGAERQTPIFYYIFDIIYCQGRSLEDETLTERRRILVEQIKPTQNIRIIEQFHTDGESAYEACVANELEGVVGKRIDSTYEIGRRSKNWLKVKSTTSAEFLICGYTEGTGSRNHTFGSLLLGMHDDQGKLIYVGGVGTGFDDKKLNALIKQMKPLIIGKCPFGKKPPGKLNPTWVKPELIAEIKFAEWTQDKILRAPVYLRLRDDINLEDVKSTPVVETRDLKAVKPQRLDKPQNRTKPQQPDAKLKVKVKAKTSKIEEDDSMTAEILEQLETDKEKLELEVEGNKIAFSNLNKVFWPATSTTEAVTKRDYAIYLARVAPYLLPHLKDRILTMVRFPNGIAQGRFYQKHWEHKLPPYVETVRHFTEHAGFDQDFLICNNLSTLLWLAQIADLELHTSHTRNNPEPEGSTLPRNYTGDVQTLEASLLNYPDYMVIDLDPYTYSGKEKKGEEPELHEKGFKQACQVAHWVKELLDNLKIEAFIKTSGRTGLHIYVPIVRTIDYPTVRMLSEIIGKQILKEHPEDVTMDWTIVKRTGKVFLDHNMNARSKTLGSIYSPRIAPEATISTPIEWSELGHVYPHDFTMRTVPDRLKKKGDLWADILDHKNDLEKLLINTDKAPSTIAPQVVAKQRKKK
ncbi:MAG: non-homologous end-joining DNA ligase [Cyanobacteria bacterium SZAS-4]|nr:non-homologous end-joining DNA ligase [Cyanobacteria bacterium SZAS-4]